MFIFLDTETTGNKEDDYLCQIAFKFKELQIDNLFKPPKPISCEAMSVHHITNKMVEDKPVFKNSDVYNLLETGLKDNILVAHNAVFDIGMLEKEGLKVNEYICTLKLARFLDKEGVIPQYKLQFLRYYLDIDIEAEAHDAFGDVLVLEKLFDRLSLAMKEEYGTDYVKKMVEISMNPLLLNKISFGKHKGLKFSEVPLDYLQWLSGIEIDGDLKHTVNYYLNKGR